MNCQAVVDGKACGVESQDVLCPEHVEQANITGKIRMKAVVEFVVDGPEHLLEFTTGMGEYVVDLQRLTCVKRDLPKEECACVEPDECKICSN